MSVKWLAIGLLLTFGCANEGGYELRWTVGDAPAAESCAANGLDIVRVCVVRGDGETCAPGTVLDESDYSCNDGMGAQSLIEAGTHRLCAEALSPAGVRLTGFTIVPGLSFNDGEIVVVSIDFPAVPQCGNGLDDDGDGRIDLEDPECSDDSVAVE